MYRLIVQRIVPYRMQMRDKWSVAQSWDNALHSEKVGNE